MSRVAPMWMVPRSHPVRYAQSFVGRVNDFDVYLYKHRQEYAPPELWFYLYQGHLRSFREICARKRHGIWSIDSVSVGGIRDSACSYDNDALWLVVDYLNTGNIGEVSGYRQRGVTYGDALERMNA